MGTRTIRAVETLRELMDDANDERHPNLTLNDVCMDLVDSYEGDTTDEELKPRLHDLEVGVETAIEPEDPMWLVNTANAVLRYFETPEQEAEPQQP